MKFIKLTKDEKSYLVNVDKILFFHAIEEDPGRFSTEVVLADNIGILARETPDEIFKLIVEAGL